MTSSKPSRFSITLPKSSFTPSIPSSLSLTPRAFTPTTDALHYNNNNEQNGVVGGVSVIGGGGGVDNDEYYFDSDDDDTMRSYRMRSPTAIMTRNKQTQKKRMHFDSVSISHSNFLSVCTWWWWWWVWEGETTQHFYRYCYFFFVLHSLSFRGCCDPRIIPPSFYQSNSHKKMIVSTFLAPSNLQLFSLSFFLIIHPIAIAFPQKPNRLSESTCGSRNWASKMWISRNSMRKRFKAVAIV